MRTATQIRNYRIRAGKSATEVAQQLGINDAWYDDLEQHDDELASTLTLFQAMELASALGVRLRDLVGDDAMPDKNISLLDLPSRIKSHVAQRGISIEQFEDEVGWELQEFIQAPLKVAAESPIIFIQAIADKLGFNWLAAVPDDNAA